MRFSLWKGGYSKLDFSTKPAYRLPWDFGSLGFPVKVSGVTPRQFLKNRDFVSFGIVVV
jgi:hypothetical protein